MKLVVAAAEVASAGFVCLPDRNFYQLVKNGCARQQFAPNISLGAWRKSILRIGL